MNYRYPASAASIRLCGSPAAAQSLAKNSKSSPGSGARTYETSFVQQFQNIGGSAKADGKSAQFSNGKLRGDAITFAIDGREFSGRVAGDRIEGTVAGGGKFVATRAGS